MAGSGGTQDGLLGQAGLSWALGSPGKQAVPMTRNSPMRLFLHHTKSTVSNPARTSLSEQQRAPCRALGSSLQSPGSSRRRTHSPGSQQALSQPRCPHVAGTMWLAPWAGTYTLCARAHISEILSPSQRRGRTQKAGAQLSQGKERMNVTVRRRRARSHLSVKPCVQRVLSAMKLALHALLPSGPGGPGTASAQPPSARPRVI